MKEYRQHISEKQIIYFRYNLALVEFFRTNYKLALRNLLQLYNDAGRQTKYAYIVTLARTLEWLCETITGNYDVLNVKFRNLQTHIQVNYPGIQFLENLLLLFFTIQQEGSYSTAKSIEQKRKLQAVSSPPEWEQLQSLIKETL